MVSIGDWYPERSFFQIFIALTSGPRFALVFLQYYLQCQASKSSGPFLLLIVGIARSLFCGGWVYITSTDHHDAHDVLMISYIVCNVPWMFGSISYTPSMRLITKRQRFVNHTKCNSSLPTWSRKYVATAFVSWFKIYCSFSWPSLVSFPPSFLWCISLFSTRSIRSQEVCTSTTFVTHNYISPFSLHKI